MSRTVDERVVEMRFDNKHFESNVATSMSTLDKLKQKLNLSGASKGLEDIDAAAKKVDMSGLSGAAETVKLKFSAMEVVAVTALANITNQAVNAGKRLIASLSVDQITAGWQKYADKTTSVATLVAQGNAIEDVNAQLDRLNWFTDETSYNFTEMVANIAKFTATGKGLNESVTAMEGIANWAALSGQNAATASRAMYQLSQAMGAGVMRLEDYKSIQNASMDTEEFRKKCIEAAVSLKTLKDNGDGTYSSLVAGASNTSFNISQFARNLTDGMWLTSDVMMKVFNDYSQAVNAIYEVTEEKGMLASEVIDEVHEKANQIKKDGMSDEDAINSAIKELGYTLEDGSLKFDAFGLKAFESAQKARTFRDAIDSVKDAVSTGWMNTFEIIFGDAEKATELWTDLANALWDIFAAGGEVRNTILEFALSFSKPWDSISEKLGSIGSKIDKVKSIGDTFEVIGDKVNSAAKNLEYWQDIVNKVWRGDYGNHDSDQNVDRFNLLEQAGYDHRVVQDLVNKGYQYQLTIEDVEESHKKFGLTLESTTAELQKNTNVTKNASKAFAKLSDEQLEQAGLTEDEIELYRALEKEADRLGMSVSDLAEDMSANDGRTLLIDSFKNFANVLIGTGNAIKSAWSDIFNPPGVGEMAVKLYGAIKALNQFSEKVRLTDKDTGELNENGKKLQRTFKGIFAIVDILRTVLGGGLKIAFKIVSSILEQFDLNILDVTASIGDMLVRFRDWLVENNSIAKAFDWVISKIPKAVKKIREWFNAFKETPAVKKFIDALNSIREAFDKLTSGEINISDFATKLGENLAKMVKSLPGAALQIGKDFIEGFKNGIVDSIGGIIKNIVNFCINLVSSFAKALGVQSPSWKAYDIATDFFQGFINGAKTAIEKVVTVLKAIGEKIINVFRSLWDFLTDESGNVEWGKIFAGGSIVGLIIVLKQVADAFSGVSSVLNGIGNLLYETGEALQGFDKVLRGIAWDFKAQAILKMAIAIGILVAAIWVLTKACDDPWKLLEAIGVIVILSGILIGMAFALNKLSQSSITLNKSGLDVKGLQTTFLQIGIAILLLAATVKMIGKMDPNEAEKGFKGLAAIAVGMIAFLAAVGGISRYSGDINGIGKMMKKLAVAMLLMVLVCKLASKLSGEEMAKGAAFAAGFAIFVRAITKVAGSAGDNVGKVGGMLIKLTIAMAMMVGVCKLASLLSAKEMLKGAAFAAGFAIFVKALVNTAKVGEEQQLAKLSGLVLSMSFSLLLLVGVCKLVGMLSEDEMIKGAAFVAGFTLLIKSLVSTLKLGDKETMGSVASTILALSLAIAILAGVSVLLSFMDIKSLAKGITAVSILSSMMTIMVKSLKGANDAKGAILMMAIAIAIMAGAVVGLSFIDTKSLISAAGAMSVMMATFALMIKSMSGLGKEKLPVKQISALLGIVLVLGGILVAMSYLKPESALSNAEALSILLLALSSSLYIMGKTGRISTTVSKQLKPMTLVIGGLALILGLLSLFPNASVMIPNAVALGILLNSLASALVIMGVAGRISTTVSKQLKPMTLVIGGLALILGLLSLFPNASVMIPNAIALGILVNALATALVIVSAAGPDAKKAVPAAMLMGIVLAEIALVLGIMSAFRVEPSIETALSLSILMLALSAACLIVSKIPSSAAIDGALGLAAFIGIIGAVVLAIGALAQIPGFNKIVADGGETLGLIGAAIGNFVGSLAGGVISGIGNAVIGLLPKLGSALSAFMTGAEQFINLAGSVDSSVVAGAAFMAAAILLLTAADFIAGIARFTRLSFAELGKQLAAFAMGACVFVALIKGISAKDVEAASSLSKMILALSISQLISELTYLIGGGIDFSTLGDNLITFGEAVAAFSDRISGKIDSEAISSAASAGMMLSELNKSLPRSGGILQGIIGEKDFGKFADACRGFATCILEINDIVTQDGFELDTEKLGQLATAGTQFAELNNSLPRTGGIAQDLAGEKDFKGFGKACKTFADCILEINEAVTQEGFKIDSDKIDQIITAGTKFSDLNDSIPRSGGIAQDLAGEKDLKRFGKSCNEFVKSMKLALSNMDGATLDSTALDSMIAAATELSDLEGSLDSIGGVVEWFAGRSDLGEFGERINSFATGMKNLSECGVIDETILSNLITSATKLSELQTSLDSIGGIVNWFVDKGDIGEFGININLFASGMQNLSQCGAIDPDVLSNLISSASKLSELESSLDSIGGVVNWFVDKGDLGEFGSRVGLFAYGMKKLSDCGVIDEAAFESIITASSKLSELEGSLTPVGGVISWFAGENDLATFGENISLFASSLRDASVDMNETSIDMDAFQNIIDASTKLSELQGSLERVGGVISWFAGDRDLGTFGENIGIFASSLRDASIDMNQTTIDADAFQNIIDATTKLSELQGSLERVGGVISWFAGENDLGTFGTNIGLFADGMLKLSECKALNPETVMSLVRSASALSKLEESLDDIGGVVGWWAGNQDLGTFGTNVGLFADGMLKLSECTALDPTVLASLITSAQQLSEVDSSLQGSVGGIVSWWNGQDQNLGTFGSNIGLFAEGMLKLSECKGLDSEILQTLIDAATKLSEVDNSLQGSVGGVVGWWNGQEENLGTFGTNIGLFADGMIKLSECKGLDQEVIDSMIIASGKLSEFEATLTGTVGGVVSWFVGEEANLGTFGTNVGLYADAMSKLSGVVVTEATITSVTNAGTALVKLQESLPEDGWFSDKMDLEDFSEYVEDFATAMSEFSEKASSLTSDPIDLAIGTAYRIKNLIDVIADLDTSGVETFTGVGSGGIGADGVAYNIAEAMVEFNNKASEIKTDHIHKTITAAENLRLLISNLVGLDTSGIDNFNPEPIATKMKNYSDKVKDINSMSMVSSIKSAELLRSFVSRLIGLDGGAVSNFKPGEIGKSIRSYYNSITGVNLSIVATSIIVASKLKSFISSLSEFNSSGAESFKKAVDQLALVNISGVVNAFSGASTKLMSAGASMISGLIKGMQSKLPLVTSAVTKILTILTNGIKSKIPTFEEVGETLLLKIGSGFTGKSKILKTAAETCASSAVTGIRDKYTQFYNAGSYLVTGFCNGISENSYKAEAKAKAMAEAAVKAAREALDINSPSKVFKEIGSGIPEGFAIGIGMLGNKVDASVTKMASSAINSGKKAMAIVLDALNSDMDSQPTIRPVVDLTDVKTGASAISGMFNGVQTVGVRSNLGAISTTMNAKLQNGSNDDIISAINKLNDNLENNRGDTYHFGNFTYDDSSNINDAVQTLVRAAIMGRRV